MFSPSCTNRRLSKCALRAIHFGNRRTHVEHRPSQDLDLDVDERIRLRAATVDDNVLLGAAKIKDQAKSRVGKRRLSKIELREGN